MPIRAVFTFGAPRVGGKNFVADYDQRPSHGEGGAEDAILGRVTWQLRNDSDIVPKVPLRLLGYEHCGQDDRSLWSRTVDRVRYLRGQMAASHVEEEGTVAPGRVLSGVPGWGEFLKDLTQMFSQFVPQISLFFGAMEKAGDSGLSHRMKEYRHYFGPYTSFWKAIDRDPEIIKAIQDPGTAGEAETGLAPTFNRGPWTNPFEREQTKGWSSRLTLAVGIVLILAATFLYLMFLSVQVLRGDVRWMGYVLMVLSAIGFVGWIKRRL